MNYRVSQVLNGERLDKALAILTNINREKIILKIESGEIEVNGKIVSTKSFRVKTDDLISCDLTELISQGELLPNPTITFKVVFEDEHILVIDKPARLVVHPSSLGSKNDLTKTLVSQLIHKYPQMKEVGESFRPGIVHRLDKDTTGLMVIAKRAQAYEKLKVAVKDHLIKRKYHAIVIGTFKDKFGKIEAPIGRSLTNKIKMAVVENGKPAVTHFKVLETFAGELSCSFVEVDLETGRTHQIRVHFSELDHAVLGDKLYGQKLKYGKIVLTRPMLHASQLCFEHPVTAKDIVVESELPDDFESVLSILRLLKSGR
jgi:23S rRNA pseudouridine1911/1915/1917 synthase